MKKLFFIIFLTKTTLLSWEVITIDTNVFIYGNGGICSLSVDKNGVANITYDILKSSGMNNYDCAIGYAKVISQTEIIKEIPDGNPDDFSEPYTCNGFIFTDQNNIPHIIYHKSSDYCFINASIMHANKPNQTWETISFSSGICCISTIRNDKIYSLILEQNIEKKLKITRLDINTNESINIKTITNIERIYDANIVVDGLENIYAVILISSTRAENCSYYNHYYYITPYGEKQIQKQVEGATTELDNYGNFYICYFKQGKIIFSKFIDDNFTEDTIESYVSSIYGFSNIVFDKNNNPNIAYFTANGTKFILKYVFFQNNRWNINEVYKIEFEGPVSGPINFGKICLAIDENNFVHLCFTVTTFGSSVEGLLYTKFSKPSSQPLSSEDTVKPASFHFGIKSAIKKKINELREKISQN